MLLLLIVKLDGVVHEREVFVNELRHLLGGRASLVHLGGLSTDRCERCQGLLQRFHLDFKFLILLLRLVTTILRLRLNRNGLIDRGPPSVVNRGRGDILQLCVRLLLVVNVCVG